MAFTPPIRRSSDSKPSNRLQSSDKRSGETKSGSQAKMPPSRTWLWFLLVLVANYLIVRFLVPGPEAPVTIPYTFFKEEVAKHNVKSIYSQGESITGRFVIGNFFRGIHAGHDGKFLLDSIVTLRCYLNRASRRKRSNSGNLKCFFSSEPEGLAILARFEFQRQNSHSHQIAAVNALVEI